MNQQKSLMNLLLVSTAALSGYRKGASTHSLQNYRTENTSFSNNSTANASSNINSNASGMNNYNQISNASNMNNYSQASNASNMNNSYQASNASSMNNSYQASNASNMNNSYQASNTSNMNNSYQTSNASGMNNSYQSCNACNMNTYNNNLPNSIPTGVVPSATAAAQADNVFLPALLAALYAADEAVNINPDATVPFTLPPLEYSYDALEPYISEDTLRIHHARLHQNYVDKQNNALANNPEFHTYTLPELLLFPDRLPSDIQAQVLAGAGGHYNHSLSWKLLGPANRNCPTGEFAAEINRQFGSFENLKTVLKNAGLSVFGTGYAWLTLNPYGRLIVVTTEEQLTPIALRTVPLLPLDVWEHSHFLDTGESRSDYIDNLMSLIDWERVGARYNAANTIFENANLSLN